MGTEPALRAPGGTDRAVQPRGHPFGKSPPEKGIAGSGRKSTSAPGPSRGDSTPAFWRQAPDATTNPVSVSTDQHQVTRRFILTTC